eukprot:233762_1
MKEILWLCLVTLIHNLSLPLPHHILSYLAFTAFSLFAFTIWCTPVFYIRSIKKSMQSTLQVPVASSTTDISPSTIIYAPSDHSDDNAVPSISITNLDQPLYVFLKDKECYLLFREYLAHCFAVESLMFVESVVILCNLLAKESVAKNEDSKQATVQLILDIKFAFLVDMTAEYKEYKLKIESVCDSEWEEQKKIYYQLCLDIFNTFFSPNALYQINIAGAICQPLNALF